MPKRLLHHTIHTLLMNDRYREGNKVQPETLSCFRSIARVIVTRKANPGLKTRMVRVPFDQCLFQLFVGQMRPRLGICRTRVSKLNRLPQFQPQRLRELKTVHDMLKRRRLRVISPRQDDRLDVEPNAVKRSPSAVDCQLIWRTDKTKRRLSLSPVFDERFDPFKQDGFKKLFADTSFVRRSHGGPPGVMDCRFR